jgi:hypothetical protein
VNVSSSSVEALLRVQATAANRTGIDVRKFYFVGEDYSGRDGPSAFVVRVSGGYTGRVTFEDNICERSAMNSSGSSGRATVMVETGYGATNVTVLNCREIGATARGGIEIKNGTDTTSSNVAAVSISLQGNTVMAEGADQALYGVAYIGTGEQWVPDGHLTITGNTIESRDPVDSGGIQTGVYVSLTPDGDGDIELQSNQFSVIRNTIKECCGDGIWLRSVPLMSTATVRLSLLDLERNDVRGCGGSALLLQKSDIAVSDYAGYIDVQSMGNMIVQNGLGVRVIDDVNGSGPLNMLNDTIAYNTAFAFKFEGDHAGDLAVLINSIVWENNGGGTQYYSGTSGWDPVYAVIEYCDFQGHSGDEGNIAVDPGFVSVANGDFHLDDDPASPCIDAGGNVPSAGASLSLLEFDIDGQRRLQDSDDDATATVDIGADEVPDPNP